MPEESLSRRTTHNPHRVLCNLPPYKSQVDLQKLMALKRSSVFTSSSEVRVGVVCQPFSNVEFYRILVTGIRLGQEKVLGRGKV